MCCVAYCMRTVWGSDMADDEAVVRKRDIGRSLRVGEGVAHFRGHKLSSSSGFFGSDAKDGNYLITGVSAGDVLLADSDTGRAATYANQTAKDDGESLESAALTAAVACAPCLWGGLWFQSGMLTDRIANVAYKSVPGCYAFPLFGTDRIDRNVAVALHHKTQRLYVSQDGMDWYHVLNNVDTAKAVQDWCADGQTTVLRNLRVPDEPPMRFNNGADHRGELFHDPDGDHVPTRGGVVVMRGEVMAVEHGLSRDAFLKDRKIDIVLNWRKKMLPRFTAPPAFTQEMRHAYTWTMRPGEMGNWRPLLSDKYVTQRANTIVELRDIDGKTMEWTSEDAGNGYVHVSVDQDDVGTIRCSNLKDD
jgi:hypothetical protein